MNKFSKRVEPFTIPGQWAAGPGVFTFPVNSFRRPTSMQPGAFVLYRSVCGSP